MGKKTGDGCRINGDGYGDGMGIGMETGLEFERE